MPLFTRCNIGLGCPHNVSVKFQPKIPNRSFIVTAGKFKFQKKAFEVYHFKCKWAAYSRPISRRGCRVYISLHCISTVKNSRWKQHNWEPEYRCSAIRMGSQKWDETARCYRAHAALTCHRRGSMDRAARPRYEQRKLISQAWCWSVKNTPCTQTNTVKMLSIITTWLSKRSLEWYTYLGRFWGTLPSKMKVIHSSLSSSDVGRKWRILCSVVHPNTEHGIACETLLMLQLLKRWENKGQLLTTANG